MTDKRYNGKKSLVHAIFECTVCGKQWQNYLTAQKAAVMHVRRTGHKVTGDLGYTVEYSKKESDG